MDIIRPLTKREVASPEFSHLLWLSAEVDEVALRRIREQELPRMTVLGAVKGSDLTGFVAFHDPGQSMTVEYIATTASARGTGLGRHLLRAVQSTRPGLPIRAETDDDAIGFYRALGFVDEPGNVDPRWPSRARYLCILRTPL